MDLIPGYKHSDVGVIPDDWDARPLGEIGDSLIGLTYRPSEVRKYGTLVLRSSNVQNGTLCFDDNVFVETDIPERIMVRPRDILVCVRNGSRDLIGKSALIDERAIGMTFGAFMGLFRSEHGELLHHVFQSGIFKKQINEHLGATINQITNKSLNSFKVPLPPTKDERTKIANALSDVDALLGSLDQVIAKKRCLKQATMQQLLTGETRLPGFAGEWELNNLGDIADIVSGGTPRTTIPSYWNGGIKWCTPTDITRYSGKYITETDRTISDAGLSSSGASLLPIGTLLLCSRATIGEVKIASAPMCTNQGFKSLVCHTRISNEFIYYKLLTMKPQMVERAFGSTFLEISTRNVAALTVVIPAHEEQIAIANVLSDIDAELSELEALRDKTRNIKQAMMQELLTGKTRLIAKEGSHV